MRAFLIEVDNILVHNMPQMPFTKNDEVSGAGELHPRVSQNRT